MARFTDDDQFDHDDGPRTSESGFPVWAIVLLCALPVAAVVIVGGAIALFSVRTAEVQRAEAQAIQAETRAAIAVDQEGRVVGPAGGMKRTYTRDEFKALVTSRTSKQIIAELGPPDNELVVELRSIWQYRNRTIDPVTNKRDPLAQIVIDCGAVIDVNFQ